MQRESKTKILEQKQLETFEENNLRCFTTSQDGGIGRHASPPRTTTKRITSTLKQKHRELPETELYGSLTTKDFKKSYSSRWVGGVELWSRGREDTVWCREEVAAVEW